jgi:hypothetical protein
VLLLLQSSLINGQFSNHSIIRRDDHDALLPTPITATKTIGGNKDEPTPEAQKRDEKVDDKRKKPLVTTEVNIIYTTIIYSPLPTIYNVSNTGSPGRQDQQQQTPDGISDPNSKKDSDKKLQDNFNQDQLALKRMITILSLVGGLGVIAIVATIVIFTRMRARNRKQREIDEEGNEGSTFELSADNNNRPTMDSRSDSNQSGSHGNDSTNCSNGTPPLHLSSSSSSISSHHRPLIEPSAPPALMMAENHPGIHHNRRTVLSMSSQTTAPSPSAPTAKELDAMVDQAQLDDVFAVASSSASASNHHHQPSTNCSRCTPILMTPELPPPAYTPSAPPHYALPVEAVVMESSSSPPTSSASSPVLPSRRHSLGG